MAMDEQVKFTIDDPRIEPVPWTGCWVWTGPCTQGYGVSGETGHAYLKFWEKAGRKIPNGYSIDHMCRTRACCNPDHLRAVPKGVNAGQNKYHRNLEGQANEFGFLYLYDPEIHGCFPPFEYIDRHPKIAKKFARSFFKIHRALYREYRATRALTSPTE